MTKSYVSLFLAVVLLLSTFSTVYSDEKCTGNEKTLKQYVQDLKSKGYDGNVYEYSIGVVIIAEKLWKDEPRGILRVKWDLREHWEIEYFKTGNCLRFWRATSRLDEKAPVGDWHEKASRTFNMNMPFGFLLEKIALR